MYELELVNLFDALPIQNADQRFFKNASRLRFLVVHDEGAERFPIQTRRSLPPITVSGSCRRRTPVTWGGKSLKSTVQRTTAICTLS
jgi:hypothetical protein